MKETIIIERTIPGLARIVLNKPETGNAYDDELICTLVTALDDLAGDPELKMVWLTGKGAHFCTGPDRQWLERRKNAGRAEHYQDAEQLARLLATLYHFPAPVLLTLRGDVNAAAVGIACCCDLVLASEHTTFCITESLFGQVPALSSPYLVKALGERAATYYALTGDSMDAYTATRLGLINRLIPGDELDAYADVMVTSMLARTVDSLRTTKQVLHLAANETYDDDLIETVIDCSTDVRYLVSENQRQSTNSGK